MVPVEETGQVVTDHVYTNPQYVVVINSMHAHIPTTMDV